MKTPEYNSQSYSESSKKSYWDTWHKNFHFLKKTVETGWATLLNTVFYHLEKEKHNTGIHSIKHSANSAVGFIFLMKFT